MPDSESSTVRMRCIVRFETAPKHNRVVRLETPQAGFLETVLSRAFHSEPNFTYIAPDERTRRAVLSWFFRSAIRAGQLYGEIYTTKAAEGGALWISPGRTLTFGRMLRTGMLPMPFKLDWGSFRRSMNLGRRVREVHHRFAGKPHWYLMALGVDPSKQGDGIGRALLEPVMSKADAEGLPCYLETFHERNLPFYEKLGFRIEGGGRVPEGGPNFWAMMRVPGRF
jgi:GNAT superfamily N-acetyltransferase